MNVLIPALLTLCTIFLASAEASPPDVTEWRSGLAAIHGAIKDQGDLGFCWANAWTSYLEAKVLIEKHKSIELSPLYVGRAHMAEAFISTLTTMNHGPIDATPANQSALAQEGMSTLSHYQNFKNNPVEQEATKAFFIRKFQKYSEEQLEGYAFANANKFGIVPTSVYEKHINELGAIGPYAGSYPPYNNHYYAPENENKFQTFIASHLLDKNLIDQYLANNGQSQLERDFDREVGNTPIAETDTFSFEGKNYTPDSFLKDYIGFSDSIFQLKPIPMRFVFGHLVSPPAIPTPQNKLDFAVAENFDSSISAILDELAQRHPVLLSMTIFDDVEHNAKLTQDGVLDPAYCEKPGDCKVSGTHAVMIVNSMKDQQGKVKAFIIQNSWGPQGTDENGIQSHLRAIRGFNIVTIDYLRKALKHRDYAFRYMML